MKTSITISLLPSSPKMPFVLGPDLADAVKVAAELGYDAFELFPPRVDAIDTVAIQRLCTQHSIAISTIGTGGGAVSQGLTLTDPDPHVRDRGRQYVRQIIELAGDLGAAAIIGSMQGRAGERPQESVMGMLCEALAELGDYASKWNQPLLYEPLNRYETDLANTLSEAASALDQAQATNAMLLADLFHMNIEETCIADAIRQNAARIGHVHFVDTNRWTLGAGHLDVEPVLAALRDIQYHRYLAVEAFPLPDQLSAASHAMQSFSRWGVS